MDLRWHSFGAFLSLNIICTCALSNVCPLRKTFEKEGYFDFMPGSAQFIERHDGKTRMDCAEECMYRDCMWFAHNMADSACALGWCRQSPQTTSAGTTSIAYFTRSGKSYTQVNLKKGKNPKIVIVNSTFPSDRSDIIA